jgi:hypothetical protein
MELNQLRDLFGQFSILLGLQVAKAELAHL